MEVKVSFSSPSPPPLSVIFEIWMLMTAVSLKYRSAGKRLLHVWPPWLYYVPINTIQPLRRCLLYGFKGKYGCTANNQARRANAYSTHTLTRGAGVEEGSRGQRRGREDSTLLLHGRTVLVTPRISLSLSSALALTPECCVTSTGANDVFYDTFLPHVGPPPCPVIAHL
ncbi:hypothetical protein Q8A73_023138 [Channa argus]|nr:hypothetical protein Q8A73_023138 [Channa argus]